MAHLHLICAGKSTLCTTLAAAPDNIVLSEDVWLKTLFGPDLQTISDYVHYSKRLQNLPIPHVPDLLNANLNVVLDFPANTLKQRAWLKTLIEHANCDHTLHVLDIPIGTCRTRLRTHNASGSYQFKVSEEQFEQFSAHYVPPTNTEGFTLKHHSA
jgi:predicted kinase